MRIMTYNILDGAAGRREAVVDTIRRADPDVLIINEANGFEANDNQVLHEFSAQIQLPYYHLEKCGDGWIYHVAVFSRSPIVSVKAIHPVARGIVCFTLEHSNGPITVVGLHLSPFSEAKRVQELAPVLPIVRQSSRLVVMGDFNSLPAQDQFTKQQLTSFSEGFQKKFALHGTAQYDVYELLQSAGLIDVAVTRDDLASTVPTSIGDVTHPPVRLDRALVSVDLASGITGYEVIKNAATRDASDHFPVVLDISV